MNTASSPSPSTLAVISMRPFLILIIVFASCDNQSSNTFSVDTTQHKTILDTASTFVDDDSSKMKGTNLYVWQVDFEHKTKTRNPMLKEQYLNVDTIIKGLNSVYPRIEIEKIKISGDTLYTQIKDSYFLGESIGTYGAKAYIADAVINLTSIKNIDFVKIDFEDGSHISPGTWSKKEFESYSVRQYHR